MTTLSVTWRDGRTSTFEVDDIESVTVGEVATDDANVRDQRDQHGWPDPRW